jgi:serine/threonine protein kinase
MANLNGQSLGRYHIIEQLGEGGMATVYKAYDTRLEREVAIKFIRTNLFGTAVLENILKRFEREAKSLASLSHPNIVKVYDFGNYEGTPYLVMEYISGGTLKSRMEKENPIGWEKSLRLLLPIARALESAHQAGTIHRDIKPGNILLTSQGQPILTDFGIAKILETDEMSTITGSGVGIGTPAYMAPEQWANKAVAQSDVYGLGVVLYEMITGRKPYLADTPAEFILKQATEPLPHPSLFTPGLPIAVEKLLIKALAIKLSDRYESIAEFANEIEKLIGDSNYKNNIVPTKSKIQLKKVGAGVLVGLIFVAIAAFTAQFLDIPSRSTQQEILVTTTFPLTSTQHFMTDATKASTNQTPQILPTETKIIEPLVTPTAINKGALLFYRLEGSKIATNQGEIFRYDLSNKNLKKLDLSCVADKSQNIAWLYALSEFTFCGALYKYENSQAQFLSDFPVTYVLPSPRGDSLIYAFMKTKFLRIGYDEAKKIMSYPDKVVGTQGGYEYDNQLDQMVWRNYGPLIESYNIQAIKWSPDQQKIFTNQSIIFDLQTRISTGVPCFSYWFADSSGVMCQKRGYDLRGIPIDSHPYQMLLEEQIDSAEWSSDTSKLIWIDKEKINIFYSATNSIQRFEFTGVTFISAYWLPDNEIIALIGVENNQKNSDIYLLSLSSGTLENITDTPDINETDIGWMP